MVALRSSLTAVDRPAVRATARPLDGGASRPNKRLVATQHNEPPIDVSYPDGWRYERFIVTIQQRTGVSWAKAEKAARATLETLGERISRGQARDLAEELPAEPRAWLLGSGGPNAEPLDAAGFVRGVAEREGVDPEIAEQHARAVFVALARLVRRQEISDMLAELPADYAPLLEGAAQRTRDPAAPEVLSFEQFLRRVADRAALYPAAVRPAAEAVLETLAERIAGGEVDDIAEYLPPELRPVLERGQERSGARRAACRSTSSRIESRSARA